MTKTKLFWRRQLCMLFCVILIFSAVFPPAYADTAVITSSAMYSYFETYSSSGYWVDIQTPAHWITDTGEVAYCLQTNKDNPSYSSYYTIDGELVYDDYVLTGLRAILNNGYPADNGGFDDEAARYATANAIRFWMAENYCDGMPQYLNLHVNGDWIRGKYGNEDLFDWALYLLGLARSQSVNPINIGSLAFSPTEITLSQDASGQYFTGTVYLNKEITGDYSLMDN
ncbi:MAG: thioester domain-containing protein, partial [Lachnospiraceae bacterium]|nr:thioester domain-containing protein [Lachnospiraceae bacterium]